MPGSGVPTQKATTLFVSWIRQSMTTSDSFSWSFIMPPDKTSVSFPKLPSAFNDVQPLADDYLQNDLA